MGATRSGRCALSALAEHGAFGESFAEPARSIGGRGEHVKKSAEFPPFGEFKRGMETIRKTRSEKETERQMKVLQETADRLFSDPKKTKEFFVSRGYVTKSGKLTARYRSK